MIPLRYGLSPTFRRRADKSFPSHQTTEVSSKRKDSRMFFLSRNWTFKRRGKQRNHNVNKKININGRLKVFKKKILDEFFKKVEMEGSSRNPKKSPSRNRTLCSKLKLTKRKVPFKHKKCYCLRFADFPQVWTELRQNQELCDGTIISEDGKVYKVHRAILSAISPYFKALFTTSLNGGKNNNEIITENIPGEYIELILDYAYTGICGVTSQNVEMLLPIADQYGVLGVVQICCLFLSQELRIDNCLGIYQFSKVYSCHELASETLKFILSHFKKITKESPELCDLGADDLQFFLKHDELNVRNEEILWEAIQKWTEKSLEVRKYFLPKLLSCIRFGLTSLTFVENLKKIPYIASDEKCLQVLEPAVEFLNSDAELDLSDPLARPRTPFEILFAVGGWSAGSPTNFVETYDTRADRWFLSVDTDLQPRAYHGLCTLGQIIYMIGGFDGNEHFNSVRSFDPVLRVWRERACMYHARCYVSVATMNGLIYAMGGYNGRIRMSSAERYDPERNQWEMIASMNKQRSDASAASLNSKMYIAGGFNGQEVLSSAEVYDPCANQWTLIASMNSARSGVSLIGYKDSIYALGGFNGYTRLSTGEKLDPTGPDLQWHEIPEMFSPRSNFATVILDDMIFVVGGFNGSATIPYVECYDGESKEWYDASQMNLNRSALSAAVVSGLPNAKDYAYAKRSGHSGGESSNNNFVQYSDYEDL